MLLLAATLASNVVAIESPVAAPVAPPTVALEAPARRLSLLHHSEGPLWIPPKPMKAQIQCLSLHEAGCGAILQEHDCLGSRDGRSLKQAQGLGLHGEPCVWCGGHPCTTGGTDLCMPYDVLMYGLGINFTRYAAAELHHQVAQCKNGAPLPRMRAAPPTLPPPLVPRYNPHWWVSPRPTDYEMKCLMRHKYGCAVVKDEFTCLGSRDDSTTAYWKGLRVRGEPCVWCRGRMCRSGSTSLCEPLDVLMRGEGEAFDTFYVRETYQVAMCNNSKPLPPLQIHRVAPWLRLHAPPTLPPPRQPRWWIPQKPKEESLGCLTHQPQGCSSIPDMGTCLSSRDWSGEVERSGLKVHGEPCAWCGGVRCQSGNSSLCEPFDFLMNGQGLQFDTFFAKTTTSVANCKENHVLPIGNFNCLRKEPKGCGALHVASKCLSSADGRNNPVIVGMKVAGQPCVWCGGGICSNNNSNMCEPFDYIVNGEKRAFATFYAKRTFRIAGCKDAWPAGLLPSKDEPKKKYSRYIPGYVKPAIGPPPLVPWWVPERPKEENISCLAFKPGGCSAIRTMGECQSSRDGRPEAKAWNGLHVHGEPCVWCGGEFCHSNGTTLCEPFDYLMHGEGRGFITFYAKRFFKIASCQKGVPVPIFADYRCLEEQPQGCNALREATSCLGSKDGRPNIKVDGFKVRGQPCVWCGGGLCTTNNNNMCEPFDYVMNGAGRAFLGFHAKHVYRIAACHKGRPRAATLQNYSDYVPGFFPSFNTKWWIAPRPSDEETECLAEHKKGCNDIRVREVCLGSKDGRQRLEWNGLKLHGEACVWCGGVTCTTSATTVCEPFDYLMSGEGKGFLSFNAKNTFTVARCTNGKPEAQGGDKEMPGGTNRNAEVSDDKAASKDAVVDSGARVAVAVEGASAGLDCWYHCGAKGGFCDYCGENRACCKSDYSGDPPECKYAKTSTWHHECVVVPSSKEIDALQQLDTTSIMSILTTTLTTKGRAWDTAVVSPVMIKKVTTTTKELSTTTTSKSSSATSALPVESSNDADTTVDLIAPGKDCWLRCGKKGGLCAHCGDGKACCRPGFKADPEICFGAFGQGVGIWHHVCIKPVVTISPSAHRDLPLKDCWSSCGKKSGLCDYCGTGAACCKKGLQATEEGCTGSSSSNSGDFHQHYECVRIHHERSRARTVESVDESVAGNNETASTDALLPALLAAAEMAQETDWLKWVALLVLLACICCLLFLCCFRHCGSKGNPGRKSRKRHGTSELDSSGADLEDTLVSARGNQRELAPLIQDSPRVITMYEEPEPTRPQRTSRLQAGWTSSRDGGAAEASAVPTAQSSQHQGDSRQLSRLPSGLLMVTPDLQAAQSQLVPGLQPPVLQPPTLPPASSFFSPIPTPSLVQPAVDGSSVRFMQQVRPTTPMGRGTHWP